MAGHLDILMSLRQGPKRLVLVFEVPTSTWYRAILLQLIALQSSLSINLTTLKVHVSFESP